MATPFAKEWDEEYRGYVTAAARGGLPSQPRSKMYIFPDSERVVDDENPRVRQNTPTNFFAAFSNEMTDGMAGEVWLRELDTNWTSAPYRLLIDTRVPIKLCAHVVNFSY